MSRDAGAGGDPGGGSSASAVHRYRGAASVGDFIELTLDTAAQTIAYVNWTNGLRASDVRYHVDPDGALSLPDDPNAHLRRALELAGAALVLDVDRAGLGRDARALAIAGAYRSLTSSDLTSGPLDVIRLRTRSGGAEVGSAVLSLAGSVLSLDVASYWPRGALPDVGQPFRVGAPPMRLAVTPDPRDAGADLLLLDPLAAPAGAAPDRLFRSPSGLALDTGDGAWMMVPAPPGAACDPARAGDYRALGYRKTGASDDADGGPESGEAGVGLLAIRVDADGGIVGADETGAVVLEGALAPAASSPDLTAPGRLDPARTTGLFTYRASASTGGVVFVVFVDRGLLFTSFAPRDADGGAPVYDYAYGAALAQ